MSVAFIRRCIMLIVCGLLLPVMVFAQTSSTVKVDDLKKRVAVLEENFQDLQTGINDFSKTLVRSVSQQLQEAKSTSVVINPLSRKVSKIETNTGTFLIAVSRMDKIDGGYRLYLQVGNTNAATYGDVKFRLYWGNTLNTADKDVTYEKWRQSLSGAEFAYTGTLEAGVWTDIAVDLKPVEYDQLKYIECEMEVNTVKLQKARLPAVDNSLR